MRDAIEATLEQLGLTVAEGQTLKDQVAMACSELGLTVAGTVKDQVAMACSELGIETGWHVEVAPGPTPLTASAAEGLAQLCQSPPEPANNSRKRRRNAQASAGPVDQDDRYNPRFQHSDEWVPRMFVARSTASWTASL